MKKYEDKDNDPVLFKGAKLSKNEAKKVGLAIIFSVAGVLVICLPLDITNNLAVFLICLALSGMGYFGISNRIFKE